VDNGVLPPIPKRALSNNLSEIDFNELLLSEAINKLKNKSAPGPDGLPPILYKKLKDSLLEPLCFFFNKIMCFGTIPEVWKIANVTPIFKKGSSTDPGNYRPISITVVCCKLFESVVKSCLVDFLDENSILNASQHGFLSKHSTCTNLIEALNDWSLNLDNKAGTLIAYVDFSKAFDSVPTPKLIYCLEDMGIGGNLLSCIKSFLTGRKQRVKIGSCFSKLQPVISGVPQGSVLGPVLFLMYIHSITDSLPDKVRSKIFADDVKSYVKIDKTNGLTDFKNALLELSLWAEKWQLSISCAKSNWMLISNRKGLINNDEKFDLADSNLTETHEIKDLGILFDSKLSFTNHITAIISNAKKRLFLLNKSFITKDASLLIKAFTVYVRPLLEYCSQIWSPHSKKDVDRIESVQRMFTKRLKGFEGLSYPERLLKANLNSLEIRRLRADLTLCYKILHNHVCIDFSKLFEIIKNDRTRGHSFRLRSLTIPKLDTRLHFFGYRVISAWNRLAALCVEAPSVQSFKNLLSIEDLSGSLMYNYDAIFLT
jgi:hypothetical protein